jgi:hypothetical protein
MSDTQLQVTELDVERAKLVQSLAKRLGATPPSSVRQVAEVKLPANGRTSSGSAAR